MLIWSRIRDHILTNIAVSPEQQIESLKAAIRELDAKIEAREGELVAAQVGVIDGEINDLELIGLYELGRKFLKELHGLRPRS